MPRHDENEPYTCGQMKLYEHIPVCYGRSLRFENLVLTVNF